jgi:Protein of unknown function (DUF4019)
MPENKYGSCLGCLGSLAGLTVTCSLFFGGGVLYRVGAWSLVLGKDVIDRQSIIASYWNELEGDKKVADESSQKFRTQMEQGQYQAAYDRASTPFKQSLTVSQWIGSCETMKQNLGSVKSAQLIDAWVQPTTVSEKYILIRYLTTFAKAPMQENFTWVVKDSKPELIQYEILRANQPIEAPKTSK